uniref:RNA-dependent RNA polymerase n=1 Tax=Erysiphe necator associated polymycovirus 3 TaxID=2742557 RepID=A0A8E4CYT5_9VIRU|nr:RNA-dependent RNA polymerase [Erysiphe necator associated polymycovirus 3]
MSLSQTSFRSNIPALATIGVVPTVASVASATVEKVTEMLSSYAARNLRTGLSVRNHVMTVSGTGGVPDMNVPVTRIADSAPPTVVSSHQRARVFFAKGLSNGDIINSLRNSDGPVKGSSGFVRDSRRLDEAAKKAKHLTNPNFEVSNYQLIVPLGFGPETVSEERPYKPVIQSQAARIFKTVGMESYTSACIEAIEVGDHTHHDPDTLHPRFLEYVHERTTDVDQATHDAMTEAMKIMLAHWKSIGLRERARPLSDATPDVFGTEVTPGSQGEYRCLGATSRNDERLVPTLCDSIQRYAEAGRQVVRSGKEPQFVHTTQQPSGMFGKNERKSAKLVDGKLVAPVPRCIFNVSPVDWALAKFLHGKTSEFLSNHDPLHGPGYGPNRGRSWKFMNVLDRAFGDSSTTPGFNLSMSDIHKWDANMCEYLLSASFDVLEKAVDKSHLDKYNLAARASMVKVAKRHLLEKLVEHPSGYFVHLFGCMPSGSYYTSLLNTIANNLLIISLIIRLLVEELGMDKRAARARLQPFVAGRLLSYGDNQIVSEELFIAVGLRYDPHKHEEHLARFGMKLKVDETEVTNLLGRTRFCSRACVSTPAGKILVRTHTSLFAKVAGTPDIEPIAYKLWLRATAIDHMGADPIVYNLLKKLDSMARTTTIPTDMPRGVKTVLVDLAQKFLDDTSPASIELAYNILSAGFPTRAAILSLHSKAEKGVVGNKMGASLLLDFNERTFELTPAARWCLSQTEDSWVKFLKDTKQEGVLVD